MAVNNFKDITRMNTGVLFTEDSEFDVRELFPSPVFFARTEKIDNGIFSEEIYRIRDEEIGKGKGNQIRSNVGGYHTHNLMKNPIFAPLQELIVDTLNKKILNNKWYNYKDITQKNIREMWSMINQEGDSNTLHIHSHTWFAGVYYVNVPMGEDPKQIHTGKICWRDPVSDRRFTSDYYKNSSTENFCITPRTGELVLFPGWLDHKVMANWTQEDRISISFNIIKTKDIPSLGDMNYTSNRE